MHAVRLAIWMVQLCVFGLSGCGSDDGGSGTVIMVAGDALVPDISVSGDGGAEFEGDSSLIADSSVPDAAQTPVDMLVDAEPAPEPDICEVMGLPRREFVTDGPVAPSFEFGQYAGGFSVNTLDGQVWSLEESWTGCESYVFLTHFPDLRRAGADGPWAGDLIWGSPLQDLMLTSPRNVQYFFISYVQEPEARRAVIAAQQERFEATLEAWINDPALRDFWRRRVHFVTDRAADIDGSVGAYLADYMSYLFDPTSVVDLGNRGQAQPPLPFAFAIDRDQRWDPVGSLSPVVGQSGTIGMATFAGHFFNHKVGLSDKLAEEDALVVPLLDEEVTARHITRTVTLPGPAEMAAFDTAEIDIEVTCPHRNVFACSEWDRNAYVRHCADPECTESIEIARWITPYWRRGTRRWVIDVSPFMGAFAGGGEQTFKIIMGPTWERGTMRKARFDLRLRSTGVLASRGVERMYTGGGFNAEYNMNHGPVSFQVPGEAARAELVVIVSGHGQSDGNNCSEWCDHRHNFAINGNALDEIRSPLNIGSLRGCADKASEGVPPGQFGNWAIGRAYWCPGWPVEAMRFDISDYLDPMENQLTYSANLGGGAPGGGNIDLSVYVVWYADGE